MFMFVTLGVIAPAQQVLAVTKTSTLAPGDQATSFAYYKALRACADGGWFKNSTLGFKNNSMSQQNASDFDWFNGRQGVTQTNGVNVGAFNDPRGVTGDGAQNCGDEEGRAWIAKAAALWGYESGPQLLCTLGFTREVTSVGCAATSEGTNNDFKAPGNLAGKLDTFWKTTLGNSSTDIDSITKLGGAYSLYLKSFQSQCRAVAGGSTYTIQTFTSGSSTPTASKFVASDRDRGTGYSVNLWQGKTLTCAQIATALSKADSAMVLGYQTYLKANEGVDESTPPTANTGAGCSATGAVTDASGNPCTPAEEGKSSCGVEGLGWIICPLLSFTATIADSAFSFLSSTFLETRSDVISDPSVRAAWATIRNIANVAFVIAFLMIIFSQLTGQGVSNYGVKKLLPRIVIAAILVNISFFICQIAVDLSNILGYSLNSALSNSYAQISGDVSSGDASGNGLGIAVIVTGIIAGAVGLALAVTGPVILAAVLALLLVVLILIARTALIVLLVIVAPLAFVAYLLPNTEQWFKKWYKMFFALLIVFPIISVVFGASTLAASVIKNTAQDNPMMQVVAIGVATLPLFVIPSLLKGSLNAAGSVGQKLSGMSSKLNGKVSGEVKNTSKLGQLGQFRSQEAKIRRAQILGGSYKGSNRNPLNWSRNASSALNSKVNQNTGKFGSDQSRLGERINAKIEAENVTAAKATIDKLGLNVDQVTSLAKGNTIEHNGRKITADVATQKAAISSIVQMGDHDATRSVIDTVGNSKDTSLRAHLADTLASSSNRPGYVGGVALGAIKTGSGINTETLARDAIRANVYSADKLATGDKQELAFIHDQLKNVTAPERAKTISNARDVLADPILNKKIGKNFSKINDISMHP